jgi:DNA-binding GntR family transcriptional regulator
MERLPSRLSEQLLEAIEERIVMGEAPPGARLDEVELAASFGVSRTPIREALIQLATMRLIEKRPRKGWVVTQMTPRQLCEMFEVMAELEAMCGRFAARRASTFQQQRIRAAHEACRDIKDPDAYYRLVEKFHIAIYEASQNEFLIEEVRQMQRRARAYRRLQLRAPDRIADSFQEHGGIVEAIFAGDSERASDLLRAHIMVQGVRFTSLVESIEKPAIPNKKLA